MGGRAFVLHPANAVITEEQRVLMERLLRERISLRGSCRAGGVGRQWLLPFRSAQLQATSDDLQVKPTNGPPTVLLQRLEAELDALWQRLPAVSQEQAIFYTDQYAVYAEVIPAARHRAMSKLARATNPVERVNSTFRQRVSRLVRATLSCSKKLTNHIGAIKSFLCPYPLTKGAAFPH